ncbi:uncharacterized protein LOC142327818 [Lycorma delicatula]|uniref:uncharacterized protein LOC142327818 n=1 Tax=Lycorma delicatula TaxID=130591 RepID=UPI003F514FC1
MSSENENKTTSKESSLKRKISQTEDLSKMKITGIAELQRYCSKNKFEHPLYKIIETTDFLNNKSFTIQCTVNGLIEIACGKNKKKTKHKAAYLLLQKLNNFDTNGDNDFINNDDDSSLEEGEINDLEEGEIKDDDFGNEMEPIKIKRYKLTTIYTEGGGKRNNKDDNDKKNCGTTEKKSDVEFLADFCAEQKLPMPRYEVSEHIGLNAPIFTCQCSVLQLKIRTSGADKEFIKAKASKMLLTKMKKHSKILKENHDNELEEGEIPDDKITDKTHMQKRKKMNPANSENTASNSFHLGDETGMGELYNYCVKLKLPPPIYTMLGKKDVSPDKKIFTFQCNVLKFSKISRGLNKKQAKHRAAKLVLEKLKNWNNAELQPATESEVLEEGEITENDEIIKKEYMKRKLETNFLSKEEKNLLLLQSITDRHNVIKTTEHYTKSLTLTALNKLDGVFIIKHASVLLNQISQELDTSYNFIDFKSNANSVTSLYLNSVPPWSTFGEGTTKVEARLNAIVKLLTFLKDMTI